MAGEEGGAPGGMDMEGGAPGMEGGAPGGMDMEAMMKMLGKGGGKGGGEGEGGDEGDEGDDAGMGGMGGMDMNAMMEMLGKGGGGGKGGGMDMGGMMGGKGGGGMMGGKGGGGGEQKPDDSEKQGEDGKWHWQQKGEEIQVRFPCDPPITKKDVSVKFKRATLQVSVKGDVMLDGSLGGTVEVDECTWCIAPGGAELQVMLTKQKDEAWNNLLV